MQCDRCGGETFTKAGRDRHGRQLYKCAQCGRRVTTRSTSAVSGYHFPDEVIALSVRWYLRFRLSYADVAEWLAERGITVDPSTVYDWVHATVHRSSPAPPSSHWAEVGVGGFCISRVAERCCHHSALSELGVPVVPAPSSSLSVACP